MMTTCAMKTLDDVHFNYSTMQYGKLLQLFHMMMG
jgi:hypothetical protein